MELFVGGSTVEELEVDGRIAAVETGRVAKGVEERVELFVGGSTVEELEVDGRVASVETGRVVKGVEVVELYVCRCVFMLVLLVCVCVLFYVGWCTEDLTDPIAPS